MEQPLSNPKFRLSEPAALTPIKMRGWDRAKHPPHYSLLHLYSTISLPHFAMNRLCDFHIYRKTYRSVRREVLREADSRTALSLLNGVGRSGGGPGPGVSVINQHGSGCVSSHKRVLSQNLCFRQLPTLTALLEIQILVGSQSRNRKMLQGNTNQTTQLATFM